MIRDDPATFSPNLAAALALAKAGYAVFPVRADAKRPHIKGWQKRASDDAEQLRRWWNQWPDARTGLPTGRRNGVEVLDIDQRDGKYGFKALTALGLDPATLSHVQVVTPSGGLYLYFAWPEGLGCSAAGLPPGVDVRGEGGFVVAPGGVNTKGAYAARGDGLAGDLIGPPDWPAALMPRRAAADGSAAPAGLPADYWRGPLMAIPNDGSIPDSDSRQ